MNKLLKMLSLALTLVLLGFPAAAAQTQENPDEAAVKRLVQTAYVDGLLNLGDLDKTKTGFHPDFVLLGLRDGKLTRFPIADWIASAEKQKAAGRKPPETTIRSLVTDITGTAASVKVELDRSGKQIYTDYLSLYKFEDGWKIVGKIYFAHE